MGIGIKKQSIEQDIGCQRHRVIELFGFVEGHIPLRPRAARLPKQELAEHAQRVIPEWIACECCPRVYVV